MERKRLISYLFVNLLQSRLLPTYMWLFDFSFEVVNISLALSLIDAVNKIFDLCPFYMWVPILHFFETIDPFTTFSLSFTKSWVRVIKYVWLEHTGNCCKWHESGQRVGFRRPLDGREIRVGKTDLTATTLENPEETNSNLHWLREGLILRKAVVGISVACSEWFTLQQSLREKNTMVKPYLASTAQCNGCQWLLHPNTH